MALLRSEVWTAAKRGCDSLFPGPLGPRGMAARSSVVEALGRLWQVEALLGSGASAAVFHARCLGEPGVPLTALKEFLPQGSGLLALGDDVDYGFSNERATLEELRGHRNIVTLYSVFTNCSSAKGPSYCLLLELCVRVACAF